MLLLLASACGPQEFVSQPGVYCSTKDEDPHFTCTKYGDVVCMNNYTYDRVLSSGGVEKVPQFSCRQACDPAKGCPTDDQVCCPGAVYGRNPGGSTHGCTPFSECQASESAADAGARPVIRRDAAPALDTRVTSNVADDGASGEILIVIDAPMAGP